jgi:K(+)-stimulated pyrophosphate-energized sodium pump
VWVVPAAIVISVGAVGYLIRDVLTRPIDRSRREAELIPAVRELGDEERTKLFNAMQLNGDRIFEGATAFLRRQYRTIALMSLFAAAGLAVLLFFFGANEAKGIEAGDIAWRTAVSFMVGAVASALSGIIGMIVAVRSNVRTASAATKSLGDALTVALRGGAVSGILIVGLSLLGVFVLFAVFDGFGNPTRAPELIVGFGFGASFVALFAQLGGGIYTKAADVGADIVGKVEAGLPEDDPRNPAVVADLVGDNVGDCAGRGADLFESTAAESIGAMILGAAVFKAIEAVAPGTAGVEWILFPLVVRAFGTVASVIGLLVIRPEQVRNAQRALDIGYWTTAVLSTVGMAIAVFVMLGSAWFFLSGVIGILTSVAFVYITQYYTSGSWRPVREIAEASRTGPATNIISGMAIGFENTAMPVLVICAALWTSYQTGVNGFEALGITIGEFEGGVFGTAVATMGMLMSAAYILAMDTFGPIADNAGGITEMSEAPEEVRDITDGLDSVGNTTKALTKGYAIASAALAAFLLFSAYLETANLHDGVNLAKVEVFVGAMLGAMLVFLFSSLAIRAVGRAASTMIQEVRRQWRENPGILEGTVEPSYSQAVDISTRSALREMILPGLLAILMPVVVGLVLRAEAEAAFLMVGTIAGVLLATVMNNGGGAWDNAKKFIEAGGLKDENGNPIGKGTPEHEASIVGDTVGDPFKDTAGPSLHVLVKLLATITLVLAPVFVVTA